MGAGDAVKRLRALALLAAGCLCAAATAQEGNRIYWEAKAPLAWQDFQAPPEEGHDYDAETGWAVEFTCDVKGDTLSFTLICYFDRGASWVKPGRETEKLLRHEQAHFDLGEVYTRKLRKALLEYSYKPQSLQQDVQKLYDDLFNACQDMQVKYDKETGHSKNTRQQEEWDRKIANELKKHEPWSRHSYKISLKK